MPPGTVETEPEAAIIRSPYRQLRARNERGLRRRYRPPAGGATVSGQSPIKHLARAVLVDANILLFAVDERSPFGPPAAAWLEEQLNGSRRVGLPWHSLGAFFRLITNPRVTADPLDPETAWRRVEDWLACEVVWIPQPTAQHAKVLGQLVRRHQVSGNLMTDAQLAALAVEHGLTICSADTDFARFGEVTWLNPLAGV